jgi:hypothetical protein
MRRTLTILAGVGFLAVSIAVALSWEDLRVRRHFRHLRGDAAYLEKILDEPEGTPERVAVRRYLETEEGKRALIRQALDESAIQSLGDSPPPRVQICLNFRRKGVQFREEVTADLEDDGEDSIPGTLSTRGVQVHGANSATTAWLELAAEYLQGELLELPELPGVVFELGLIDFGRPWRVPRPSSKNVRLVKTPPARAEEK